jgi:hypothetical protein
METISNPDIRKNCLPISEIAENVGITPTAAKGRIVQRGIKPIGYMGRVGFYAPNVIDEIKDPLSRGKGSPKYGKGN